MFPADTPCPQVFVDRATKTGHETSQAEHPIILFFVACNPPLRVVNVLLAAGCVDPHDLDVAVGVRANTVQLASDNGERRRPRGLRIVLMACAFGCPFDDFAFDYASVGTWSSCGVDSAQ